MYPLSTKKLKINKREKLRTTWSLGFKKSNFFLIFQRSTMSNLSNQRCLIICPRTQMTDLTSRCRSTRILLIELKRDTKESIAKTQIILERTVREILSIRRGITNQRTRNWRARVEVQVFAVFYSIEREAQMLYQRFLTSKMPLDRIA